MSHVDEGALHAYLDGALDEYPAAEARRVREHVETCAVCAERLAEERRVREDARAILDLAAPKVEVPTFEELRAYVRAGGSRRSAFGRLHKMGWAASVVLALGTGWLLRGGPVDPVRSFEAERSAPPAASPERAVEGAGTATSAATTQVAPQASAAVDQGAQADTPAPPPVAAEPPTAPLERASADAPAVGGAGSRAEVAQAPAAVTAPPAAPAPEVVRVTGVDARALADTRTGAGAGGGALAGYDDRQADAARTQARLDSAARAAESRRRISADQVVASTLDAAPAAPTLQRTRAANEVERDEDEEEGESLVVPGLEVLTVENLGEGTAFAGTRSLQRLASGDTLEVIHLPEGVEPTLLASPRAGRNQLVRQHPDGWLVMRAALTLIELEQLLERLEAGR